MYLPSSPRYAWIPESTLTPAPVNRATFPNPRNSVNNEAASDKDFMGHVEVELLRMA